MRGGFCLPVRDSSQSIPLSANMPPAPPRRQLNVRLPPDIIEQIEAGERSKQDVVADALRAWFADDDSKVIADDSSENSGGRADDSRMIADDSGMVAALTGQLGEKDRQISELHIMLQTAITPPARLPAAEPEARKWWQVWKR